MSYSDSTRRGDQNLSSPREGQESAKKAKGDLSETVGVME